MLPELYGSSLNSISIWKDSVAKYLNTQVFKYYLNTVTGIWKRYLNNP